MRKLLIFFLPYYLFLIVFIKKIEFGDNSDRDTPGNISNPVVKSVNAEDT